MNIGPLELTIILAIVILIFGVGRIGRIGGELGGAIRAFREGLNEDEALDADGGKPGKGEGGADTARPEKPEPPTSAT